MVPQMLRPLLTARGAFDRKDNSSSDAAYHPGCPQGPPWPRGRPCAHPAPSAEPGSGTAQETLLPHP